MPNAEQLKNEKSITWQLSKFCGKSCSNCMRMGYRSLNSDVSSLIDSVEKLKQLEITNVILPCNFAEVQELEQLVETLKKHKIKSTLIIKDCLDFSELNFDLLQDVDYLVLSYTSINRRNQMAILQIDQMFQPIYLLEQTRAERLVRSLDGLPNKIIQDRLLVQLANDSKNIEWSIYEHNQILKVCQKPLSVIWPSSSDLNTLLESNIRFIGKELHAQPRLSLVFFAEKNFREFKDFIHHLSCQHVEKEKVELVICDFNNLYNDDKLSVEFILEEAGFNYKLLSFDKNHNTFSEQEKLAIFDVLMAKSRGDFIYPIEYNKLFNLKEFSGILNTLKENKPLVIRKNSFAKSAEIVFPKTYITKGFAETHAQRWVTSIDERLSIIYDFIISKENIAYSLTTKINPTVRKLSSDKLKLKCILVNNQNDQRDYIRDKYKFEFIFTLFILLFKILITINVGLMWLISKTAKCAKVVLAKAWRYCYLFYLFAVSYRGKIKFKQHYSKLKKNFSR